LYSLIVPWRNLPFIGRGRCMHFSRSAESGRRSSTDTANAFSTRSPRLMTSKPPDASFCRHLSTK
jgi:hypothetical protein